MQSSNVKEIKAALYNQAFIGAAQVSCPMGQVVAVRKAKGQLKALVRGWGRWQVVESVTIAHHVRFAPQAASHRSRTSQNGRCPASVN